MRLFVFVEAVDARRELARDPPLRILQAASSMVFCLASARVAFLESVLCIFVVRTVESLLKVCPAMSCSMSGLARGGTLLCLNSMMTKLCTSPKNFESFLRPWRHNMLVESALRGCEAVRYIRSFDFGIGQYGIPSWKNTRHKMTRRWPSPVEQRVRMLRTYHVLGGAM